MVMSTSSKNGHYAVVALLTVVLTLSSYYYLTKRKFPSNHMYFLEESFVHKFLLKRKNQTVTTMKAHGITSAARKTVWSLLDSNATASLPLPLIGSYQCRDQICSEFLSAKDRENICFCINSLKFNIVPKCHFMNGTHRAPVALVSFPGSGNTWVRGLLEKATGVCTGSGYCDSSIRKSGAIGEHVTSGSVLVVKTHSLLPHFSDYTVAHNSRGYGAAILLVRNPLQAMVSDWNRRLYAQVKREIPAGHNPHVASIPEKYFGNYTKWQTFISRALLLWKRQILNVLLKSNGHPVLVVHYEDVLKNSTTEVKRMLDFLQVPYTKSNLKKRLAEDYTTFYRNHTSTYEHFTESQKQLVRTGINDVLHKLKETRITIPRLKEYLASTALNVI